MQDFSHHNRGKPRKYPLLSTFDPQRIGPAVFDELFFGRGRYTLSLSTRARALACSHSWEVYLFSEGLAPLCIVENYFEVINRRAWQADTIIRLSAAAETILCSLGWSRDLRHIPLTTRMREAFYTDLKSYAEEQKRHLPPAKPEFDRSLKEKP